MIQLTNIAKIIRYYLSNENEISRFKIYVRINYSIDVYIVCESIDIANTIISNLRQKENIIDSCNVKFFSLSLDQAKDPFYSNILADGNEIELGPRYRFDSILGNKFTPELKKRTSQIPVITFYSYKGGMGRTTTMVSYAMDLAINQNKRVVIIDCDLEAPGYLNFFNLKNHEGLRSGNKNGLVEFFSDALFLNSTDSLDIDNYIVNVGLSNKSDVAYRNLDNIWLVPAGNLNEGYDDLNTSSDRVDYLEGLSRINLSSVDSIIRGFDLLFDKIKEAINPDVILLDSRTGFNDIFGTVALFLSNYVVGFFGFSHQTEPGLIRLLNDYYNQENKFSLQLVFSIIPENSTEEWINNKLTSVKNFINYIATESKDKPDILFLHRNPLLEIIGTGDSDSEKNYVELIKQHRFIDYNNLFERLNTIFPKRKININISRDTSALQLRNIVLKHLKDVLAGVANFAEDTEINEAQFFYRNCMKEFFNNKKFLVQGYKGTGKTYLYKALSDSTISANVQQWANDSDDFLETIFVNILPTNDGEASYPFGSIRYSKIEEPDYYFNAFWQILTWNNLLMRPEFEAIRMQSELSEFILPIIGQESVKRIDELIDNGIDTLIVIEKDFQRINEYLANTKKQMFIMYDRLDTCINPLRWHKAVSPLINYWRDHYASFSNISPKIFVRTDLFKQIEGTNTARLSDNIIDIEWSIGEVFGYFFKLIFSDEKASLAYWAIAEKVGIDAQYIKLTKQSFNERPFNQFKTLNSATMTPIIQVFFGKNVNVGEARLGSPWQYFEKELSNANGSISLRPFINTLNENAVDKALGKTERYVREIISPEIYASKSVREDTTERYFDDLTKDAFSKDLIKFKDVIRTSGGEQFRYKSLSESQYNELLTITFSRIIESQVVKTIHDLDEMIRANGIMAKKPTTKGVFYTFAPIYWYTWGLVNSDIEIEEKRQKKAKKKSQLESSPLNEQTRLQGVLHKTRYSNPYITIGESPFKYEAKGLSPEFIDGDEVTFKMGEKKKPTLRNPNAVFRFAYDIKLAEY